MSLDNKKAIEFLQELKQNLEETVKLMKDLTEALTLMKEELSENLEDVHKELLAKIQEVKAYQENILEPNQHTLLDAIQKAEETEQEEEK